MRFVLSDDVSLDAAEAFRAAGHVAETVASWELEDASTLVEAARRKQYEVVVADRAHLDAILPASGDRSVFGRVLVFLRDEPAAQADGVAQLFSRFKRLSPGRLYTVGQGHAKASQLPGSHF